MANAGGGSSRSTSVASFSRSANFARELTPTWLAATALLAGQRPPDLTERFHVVDLRCRNGINAAVIAACHPKAQVWACDADPSNVEATRRLASAAGLDNLSALELAAPRAAVDGRLPHDVEIVLLHDVLTTVDDDDRSGIVDYIARGLRPGGLVGTTYRTLSGWSELHAVRRVAQLAGRHAPKSRQDQVEAAVEMIERLRQGGARYFSDRPYVSAVMDELVGADREHVADQLLSDHLQPMTLADVAADLGRAGCTFLGSARLGDELGAGMAPPLQELIADVPDVGLREALRDIATHQGSRVDVFRKGSSLLTDAGRRDRLLALELIALTGTPDGAAADGLLADVNRQSPIPSGMLRTALDQLQHGRATLERLLAASAPSGVDDSAAVLLRVLLAHGIAHPVSAHAGEPVASERCRALNSALAELDPLPYAPVLAASAIGSAIPSTKYELEAVASGAIARDAAAAAVRRRPMLTNVGIL